MSRLANLFDGGGGGAILFFREGVISSFFNETAH